MKNYLEFEQDIKLLEEELEKLKDPFNKEGLSEIDTNKISDLQNEIDKKLGARIIKDGTNRQCNAHRKDKDIAIPSTLNLLVIIIFLYLV